MYKGNKINFNEYTDCLRICIVPDYFEDERVDSVVNFCVHYGFKNVMLFINAEEYNLGHMTISEAQPWVKCMVRAKDKFIKNGISVSLNPWIEIGHEDRGRKLKENQNFQTMVGLGGEKSEMVACPLDKEWRCYFKEFYKYLLEELHPAVVWVEDDFRLHNHNGFDFGGCFCPLHMKEYNSRLGTDYTREEFVKKIFDKGKVSKERICWLDTERFTMSDTAMFIGNIVKTYSPDTLVGLMSSEAGKHCMEGRDWKEIHCGLSKDGTKINRIHLPCYIERSGKEYYCDFNSTSMIVRAFLEDDVKIYPELENAAFSTFSKDSRFLRFQVESAIPLCISGMTYDIFDFVGNGAIDEFGYGQELQFIRPYMQAVLDLELKFSKMKGVIIPLCEKACYYKENVDCWQDLYPDEFSFVSLLSGWGISYKLTTDRKVPENEIVALVGGCSDYFNDDELKNLFMNNDVFVDGLTILKLKNRNLLNLAGIKNVELYPSNTGVQSYEQLENGSIYGIKGYRASALAKAGDFINIEYSDISNKKIITKLYDHKQKFIGNGIVKSGNVFVFPFIVKKNQMEQYNPLRRETIKSFVVSKGKNIVVSDYQGIYSYLYERQNGYALIMVNTTVNNFDNISFNFSGFNIVNIKFLDKTGNCKYCKVIKDKNHYTICEKFEYLSTVTLLLEDH